MAGHNPGEGRDNGEPGSFLHIVDQGKRSKNSATEATCNSAL